MTHSKTESKDYTSNRKWCELPEDETVFWQVITLEDLLDYFYEILEDYPVLNNSKIFNELLGGKVVCFGGRGEAVVLESLPESTFRSEYKPLKSVSLDSLSGQQERYGFITPKGEYYSCYHTEHKYLTRQMFENPTIRKMEKDDYAFFYLGKDFVFLTTEKATPELLEACRRMFPFLSESQKEKFTESVELFDEEWRKELVETLHLLKED